MQGTNVSPPAVGAVRLFSPVIRTFRDVPAVPAIIVLVVLAYFLAPRMLSTMFILIILRQAVPLALVAMGQALPIIGRSIDLSVSGLIALVNVVLSTAVVAQSGAWVSFALPVAFGIVVGLANGFFVVVVRASAVVVTLGMSVILLGISYLISGGAPGGEIHPLVEEIARGRMGSFPYAGIFLLGVAAILSVLMARSVFGHSLSAIGGNYRAAWLSGVPVDHRVILAHVLCSVLAAIAGVFLTGYIGTGTLDLGTDLVLASVAAVVLGGTIFGVSTGGIPGVVLGAFTLTFLSTLLTAMGIDRPFQFVLQGVIIAGAATLSARHS